MGEKYDVKYLLKLDEVIREHKSIMNYTGTV